MKIIRCDSCQVNGARLHVRFDGSDTDVIPSENDFCSWDCLFRFAVRYQGKRRVLQAIEDENK